MPDPNDDLAGLEWIAAERERQVTTEGYSEAHDDTHRDGELARAAACYAAPHEVFANPVGTVYVPAWPWRDMDKRLQRRRQGEIHEAMNGIFARLTRPEGDDLYDRVRELAKAGAMIAAEIDRLMRSAR